MNPHELRSTFALANAFKEGDLLVGGTTDDRIRQDARRRLLATRLGDIRDGTLVEDGVTTALERARDRRHDSDLERLTVSELRRVLAGTEAASWADRYRDGLSSEMIAAVAKVMSDDELASAAGRLFNPLDHGDSAIGAPWHFGSRLQPNSAGDDEEEILFSIFEGLSYGCGDVILGINPAANDLETIVRLEQLLERVVGRLQLPTRYCVLSDIVKQDRLRQHTRVDVGFQSLAGTSMALRGMVGLDVDGILDLARSFDGLYFETGQGSAVTNGAAEGVDMVTLEARAYGVARHLQQKTGRWTIVNDVAGFIGPEVFATAEQLERTCLEDAFMAKLHGLTVGLDVCATFHMGIPPAALHRLTERIVRRAAPAYLMAVPGNADPMLGYLTTSFREHPHLRRISDRSVTTAMRRRLVALGALTEAGDPRGGAGAAARLYASYLAAGGDVRSAADLELEGRRKLAALGERGLDLGYATAGDGADFAAPPQVAARLDAIYTHARRALYATLEEGVIREVCSRHVRVRTLARDREDYLAHPRAGERLGPAAARTVASLYPATRPQVQIVLSDGLNANAVNEQCRRLLPPLRRALGEAGGVGEVDVVIENGRVRAGYHVGALTGATIVVHIIGERPGTGLNTVSAYLTYGRDEAGRSRWDPALDHSCTTAVCGIHPGGKPPEQGAAEIARLVARMLDQRRSGLQLR